MSANIKEGFSSSFGSIMAAVGSAVGLGNIWRFPYICGKYGGGAFLLVYVFFVFMIGMVLLMSEFVIGRRSCYSSVKAFAALAPRRKRWHKIGSLCMFTCLIILAIYIIISGWTLNYFFDAVVGSLAAVNDGGYKDYFAEFVSSPIRPTVSIAVFLVLCVVIVLMGVQKGIEGMSKVMMPILVILLLIMCVYSVSLPGASAGLDYLFHPDFSKLGWEGLLAALGQALFSLSVGMGTMITYGSYLPPDDNLLKTSMWITACDFLIAVMAGIAIFPAVFSCGMEPAGGPGLVYMVLPAVFKSMGMAGRVLSIVFFLLLSLAAITSSISLLETITSGATDRNRDRKSSVWHIAVMAFVMAIVGSLSFDGGVLSGFKIGGHTFYEWLDLLSAVYLPPITAFFTVSFFGWVMSKYQIYDELSNHGTLKMNYIRFFFFLARYVAPMALLFVFLSGVSI